MLASEDGNWIDYGFDEVNNKIDEDYLDLERMSEDNYKKELIEYNYGYSEKGYLKMCHRCRGKNAEKFPIPVAEKLMDENT